MTFVKICGLTDARSVDAALEAGADAVGFVIHESSPRYVSPADAARLAVPARGRALITALVIAPDDARAAEIADALAPDVFQLYDGALSADTRRGRELWRAYSVRAREDLPDAVEDADRLLLDAPPPAGAKRSGGGWGATFDWSLLAGWAAPKPWILAGGLTPENVAEAIEVTGATAVDVSSGVESSPGVKDIAKIRDFIQAAKSASSNGATA
ncbi:MAG: phosphoribosylanthranilate isomerase [Maricaulaceae bacterium]|jgi:phosphoribosylanthranilate isomerase